MKKVYDVAIIGGGVAGLSASICSASEGFSTIILESNVNFGGQAGTASLIENLIGFPEGISGVELTRRAIEQANKFNVKFQSPFNVISFERENGVFAICSDAGDVVNSKTILLAMGVSYKRLETENIDRYLGMGAYYGSPSLSETICNSSVTVVGGANSAGQAAVYLASCTGCNVNLIVRADSIEKGMSHYLTEKIKKTENIKIFLNSEIIKGEGKCSLESVTLNDGTVLETQKLFILIGAKPKTSWLKDLPMDEEGYIKTDNDLRVTEGIFSAGDARSESVKRVSCALGEGGKIMRAVRQDINKINETYEKA